MGRRISIYVVGLAITALGIALVILSTVGTGPWDTVAIGLNLHLGLTIGTWSLISQACLVLITGVIERRRPRYEAIIPIVIRSIFLDVWGYIVFGNVHFTSWEMQWLSLLLGVILSGVGIGIYMEARFPKTPVDGLMAALQNRFGWSMNISRLVIEISGVLIGFLLGGPVGAGTLVIALSLGKIIQTTNGVMKRKFNKEQMYFSNS